MARQVKCPACGAVGEVAPFDREVFVGRGQVKGKPVVKCLRCGSGLFIGLFSGVFVGRPKVIPAELWSWMEEQWEARFGRESH